MRRKREVQLSSFLKDEEAVQSGHLDLQGKGITQIDELSPSICHQIQSLNLKCNRLTQIRQLAKFSRLKELDLSENRISDCGQLLALRGLTLLSKLSFGGNPFLSEPISQEFLEFIVEKQTDIEVLSFDLVREVENEEIKIIFLKNYISKIDLHQELRHYDETRSPVAKLKTESLMESIIPQFYPSIASPKLTSTIKKEALTIKKAECEGSFREALVRSKRQKGKQIDNLIGTIVNIMHKSNAFIKENTFVLQVDVSNNTISFSPEKCNKETQEKKGENKETAFSQKKKEGVQKERNKGSQKERHRQRSRFNTPTVFKGTLASDRKTEYIKVVEEVETDDKYFRRSPEIDISPSLSTIKCSRSKVSDQSQSLFHEFSPERIETIYFKTLVKIHPMFSLLASPAASLNNEEKNVLLQALKTSHRQNFTELVKERISNQNLMKELDVLEVTFLQKLQVAERESLELAQRYGAKEEECEWTQKRYRSLKDDYNLLFQQLKEVKTHQHNQEIVTKSMEASYHKIKTSFSQAKQTLQQLQACEERQEKLVELHQQRLRQIYIKKLSKKAAMWRKVLDMEWRNKEKRKMELYDRGMESFISVGLFRLKQKILVQKREQNEKRNAFEDWLGVIMVQKKERTVAKRIKHHVVSQFWQLLRKNDAESKMGKLRNIWALSLYRDKTTKPHFELWRSMLRTRKENQIRAEQMADISIENRWLCAWKEVTARRRLNASVVSERHIVSQRAREFGRLVYLMKRQMVENREKEHTVRMCHEHELRKTGFATMRRIIRSIQKVRTGGLKLTTLIASNCLSRMRLNSQRRVNLLQKGRQSLYAISFGAIKKELLLQKQSQELSSLQRAHNMRVFVAHLREHSSKKRNFWKSKLFLAAIKQAKYQTHGLRLIKELELGRLKGCNYVKHRAIREMDFQMGLNDQRAFQLIKSGQMSLEKCGSEIGFLKKQIQNQSGREMGLLAQKDAMMLTINQSHEIMVELGREVSLVREQSIQQDARYNELARKYNEVVAFLQTVDPKQSPRPYDRRSKE